MTTRRSLANATPVGDSHKPSAPEVFPEGRTLTKLSTSAVIREWKRNWTAVLAAACGVGLTGTPGYTMGVFIAPLQAEFGWSRAAITSALMFHAAAAFFSGPVVGYAVDRLGARRVGITGTILMSLGFVALSRVNSSLVVWWSVWTYMALVGLLVKHTVWTASIVSLFSHGRGLAMAVALCGTSIGSAFAPVLCGILIEWFGWRIGYLGLAIFFGLVVTPVLLLYLSSELDRRRLAAKSGAVGTVAASLTEEDAVPLVGVTAREGIFSWRYFRLGLAAIIMVLVVTNLMINLVPIITSFGHPRFVAVSLAGVAGISTIVGRLSAGYLLDRINGNFVAAISCLLPIISCLLLLLLPGSYLAISAAALIVGLSLGSEYDAVAYLVSRHFGTLAFGTIFGLLGGFLAAAAGIGPVMFNYVYDVGGTYVPAIIVFVPACVLAAALFASLGKYPDFEAMQTAAAPAR